MGLEMSTAKDLLERMKREGKRYAVFIANPDGTERAYLLLDDETVIGFDQKMLECLIPMLQKAHDSMGQNITAAPKQ